jgi:hypothetical protein
MPFLLIVTGPLNHGLTWRPAPETTVALWAWKSFARMARLNILARKTEKAGRTENAGGVRISYPVRHVCPVRKLIDPNDE